MPETVTRPPAAGETMYRPLSLLALAGLGLGLVAPAVFLIDQFWVLLFLPLPGLIVSGLARRAIRRSEGTLAGAGAAAAGLALNLVVILAYLTMVTVTDVVINREATAFVEQWLAKIHDGKEGEAFLDTQPPRERHTVQFPATDVRKLRARFPSKGGGGSDFDGFRANQILSPLLRYGPELAWKIHRIDWMYQSGSYYVNFRVLAYTAAPGPQQDLKYEAILTVTAISEVYPDVRGRGPRRDWRILLQQGDSRETPTLYSGKVMTVTREVTDLVLRPWFEAINAGKTDEARQRLRPGDEHLRRDFEAVVAVLRKNALPGGAADLALDKVRAFQVIKEVAGEPDKPNAWRLTLRGFLDRGRSSEVELQITVETADSTRHAAGWQITDCRILTERRKAEPTKPGGGGPPRPGGM
jgi:hypothetical protein